MTAKKSTLQLQLTPHLFNLAAKKALSLMKKLALGDVSSDSEISQV